MSFDWRHWIGLFLVLTLGYYLGSRWPGMLTKYSRGAVTG